MSQLPTTWERQFSFTRLSFIVDYKRCWTSVLRKPKGKNNVSILERCPFYRGHHNGALKGSTDSYKSSIAKRRRTLVLKVI